MTFEKLLHGHDTVQCAYYLHVRDNSRRGIHFERLVAEKEALRTAKVREPKVVRLGDVDFLLQPYGTASGYPLVITNRDYRIEMGEYMKPSFFVTFTSEALWRDGAIALHEKFLAWAASVGLVPYHDESLSRVDFSFDYYLSDLDFDENSVVSLSKKDSRHREHGKVQTITYGKGDVVMRFYDKVAEIQQQSHKTWFFPMWGRDNNVWRIEWQVRRPILKRFGIVTFADLYNQQGDLLRYLADEHETVRIPSGDSNRSRWPLHPLWADLQAQVSAFNCQGIYRVIPDEVLLTENLTRLTIILQGYVKRIGAIMGLLQNKDEPVTLDEAVRYALDRLVGIHDPLTWRIDVKKRMDEIRLGYGK